MVREYYPIVEFEMFFEQNMSNIRTMHPSGIYDSICNGMLSFTGLQDAFHLFVALETRVVLNILLTHWSACCNYRLCVMICLFSMAGVYLHQHLKKQKDTVKVWRLILNKEGSTVLVRRSIGD